MIHCCKAASQKMNISTLHLVVYSTSQSAIPNRNTGDAKRPLNELP